MYFYRYGRMTAVPFLWFKRQVHLSFEVNRQLPLPYVFTS